MLNQIPFDKVQGKKIFFRADVNVPLNNGKVSDDSRIAMVAPTIKKLCDNGAKVILTSHLGRPKGEVKAELSLQQLMPSLQQYLNPYEIIFCADNHGDDMVRAANALQDGQILLLENLRFCSGEEKNDADLAQKWANIADIYINDAFSCAHRAHASTAGIAEYFADNLYIGDLFKAEINALYNITDNPKHPNVAIIGGAKISTKITVLENFLPKIDNMIIAGAMANTFMVAMGKSVGDSLIEQDYITVAKNILDKAKQANCTIHLPKDYIVADKFSNDATFRTIKYGEAIDKGMILDIGSETIADYKAIIDNAKMILWNGPLGAFEMANFAHGSLEIAKIIAQATQDNSLYSVAGGGDTLALLNKAGLTDKLTYVSSAGGAFLEFLEGKSLPGIKALDDGVAMRVEWMK